MNKKDIRRLRALRPEAISLFREDYTYKAYDTDAQTIYSVLMNRPMERLGNIAEVIIKKSDLESTILKLVRASKKIAIHENLVRPR